MRKLRRKKGKLEPIVMNGRGDRRRGGPSNVYTYE
jgi:hypothetical protein